MKPHYLQIIRNPYGDWDREFIASKLSNLQEVLHWTYMFIYLDIN
jgi:hypothetical protein